MNESRDYGGHTQETHTQFHDRILGIDLGITRGVGTQVEALGASAQSMCSRTIGVAASRAATSAARAAAAQWPDASACSPLPSATAKLRRQRS